MFNQEDLAHADNLVRALKKGKYELEGMEVLALADAMRWLSRLTKVITIDLEEQQKPPVTIEPLTSPVTPPQSKGSKKK